MGCLELHLFGLFPSQGHHTVGVRQFGAGDMEGEARFVRARGETTTVSVNRQKYYYAYDLVIRTIEFYGTSRGFSFQCISIM